LFHHPFCADFKTPVLITKVQSYEWQCGMCKLCQICKQAGADEKLMLLCDTCDRGYHTYCLSPDMKEPPKGTIRNLSSV
jgi:hypothetical protein